jgi:hypothetical protein
MANRAGHSSRAEGLRVPQSPLRLSAGGITTMWQSLRSGRRCCARFAILMALTLSACAPSGYVYEVGNFVRPHPTQALCASRGQVFDTAIEDCVTPSSPGAVGATGALATVAFNSQGETYEQDRAWTDRIEHGACTRLRDRRTDAPADVAECHRDHAMQPPCISYKGFASTSRRFATFASASFFDVHHATALHDVILHVRNRRPPC